MRRRYRSQLLWSVLVPLRKGELGKVLAVRRCLELIGVYPAALSRMKLRQIEELTRMMDTDLSLPAVLKAIMGDDGRRAFLFFWW